MADDENDSPLLAAIRYAAYTEINQLAELYQRTPDLANCLPLMQPERLRQIVSNSLEQLSLLCYQHLEELHAEAAARGNVSAPKPSIRMMSDIKGAILGDPSSLQREIDHYEVVYTRYLGVQQAAATDSENSIYGAGAVGGILGGMLLGPLGAVIGSMAAGAWAGSEAQEAQQLEAQRLCAQFASVYEATNSFLEGMARNCLNLLLEFSNRLQPGAPQGRLQPAPAPPKATARKLLGTAETQLLEGKAMFGLKKNSDPRVKSQLDALDIKYEIDKDGDYRVSFALEEGRSQLAFVNSKTSMLGNFEIRDVWSVAHISEGTLDADFANYLLLQNANLKIGAWELREAGDNQFLVCFCNKIAADCDPEALRASLIVVLSTADELEKNLDTGDRF